MPQKNFTRIAAVLFAFIVMSFVDMVGVATDCFDKDENLNKINE